MTPNTNKPSGQVVVSQEQLEAIKAYWRGCQQRKVNHATPHELAWARGQMDGFERAILILTGSNPMDVLELALNS